MLLTRREALIGSASALALAVQIPARAQDAKVFRIGALNPITGAGSAYGSGMQKAIAFAIDEVNVAGGAGGRKLQMFAEDSQTSADAAVLAARKLIEINKVDAILGTWSSGETLAIMPMVQESGIIEMNASAAAAVQEQDKKDLVWRFEASNKRYGQAFLAMCEKRGFKRPATMALNAPSSLGNAQSFERAWEDKGKGKVVASVVYEPKRPSYRSELQQVLAANPDVIVAGCYTPDAIILLREAYELGAKSRWIMPGGSANDQVAKALPPDVTNGVIAIETVANEGSPALKRFSAAYVKATGHSSVDNIFAAMTYDMVISLALAIEAAGSNADRAAIDAKFREVSNPPGQKVSSFEEGKALLKQGKKIDYDGASGPIDYDEAGDVTPLFGVYVFEGGKRVRKDTIHL